MFGTIKHVNVYMSLNLLTTRVKEILLKPIYFYSKSPVLKVFKFLTKTDLKYKFYLIFPKSLITYSPPGTLKNRISDTVQKYPIKNSKN